MKLKLSKKDLGRSIPNSLERRLRNICKIATLMLVLCFFSCQNMNKSEKLEDVIDEWIGKEIKFPPINTCSVLGEFGPCRIIPIKPFRILVYVDSVGCTSCDLRIDEWKRLSKESDSVNKGKVDFVFYFNPKKDNELSELLKRENFKNQVYIDINDELNKANQFPKKMDYQCFLLDENNKVLVVGNPTLNRNVWRLYKRTIGDKKDI